VNAATERAGVPGMRIQLDPALPKHPDFLRVVAAGDADIPLRIGDGLPFPDRAVAAIDAGRLPGTLDAPDALALLLECRRVLRPGGMLRLDTTSGAAPPVDLCHLVAQVGLAPASPADAIRCGIPCTSVPAPDTVTGDAIFAKPDRGVTGNPLVSIVVPAYNPRFFEAALESALVQTYDPIEIIVCDDSEGPEIESIAKRHFGRREIRYVRNPTRLRTRANYGRCIDLARGEFVKFLNDDDLLTPECVELLLDAFRKEPDVALATSRRQRIDAAGNTLPDQPATLPIVAADSVIAGFTLANAMLMVGLNIVGEPSTTMFRRADLLLQKPDYFCFDGAYGWGVIDMATWSTLLLMGNAVYRTARLSSFRIHPEQRQHDPEIRERTVTGIRNLQAVWLRLGLHARQPADHLLVKPYPAPADESWRLARVLSYAPPAPRATPGGWNPNWSGGYPSRGA